MALVDSLRQVQGLEGVRVAREDLHDLRPLASSMRSAEPGYGTERFFHEPAHVIRVGRVLGTVRPHLSRAFDEVGVRALGERQQSLPSGELGDVVRMRSRRLRRRSGDAISRDVCGRKPREHIGV